MIGFVFRLLWRLKNDDTALYCELANRQSDVAADEGLTGLWKQIRYLLPKTLPKDVPTFFLQAHMLMSSTRIAVPWRLDMRLIIATYFEDAPPANNKLMSYLFLCALLV